MVGMSIMITAILTPINGFTRENEDSHPEPIYGKTVSLILPDCEEENLLDNCIPDSEWSTNLKIFRWKMNLEVANSILLKAAFIEVI